MVKSVIKTFEIRGLFNQYNVMLPLEQNINIFLGENGMGKTTILNCLYYVLNGDFEKLNSIPFEEISITLLDNETFELNHNDVTAYVQEYLYENSAYRRRRFRFEAIFSAKELEEILNIYQHNTEDDELKKYYYKISDVLGMPMPMARRELTRYILLLTNNNDSKGDYSRVVEFKEKLSHILNYEILYFPTYRRIEEDISNLGIDIERDGVKNRLIQFGMSDVEKNIKKLLATIKSVAITGFTKMTGVLIKQYLNGKLSSLDEYIIDQDKLAIALARIGDEIEYSDKQRIIELVNNSEIYNSNNIYLLNLIKNLIDSYEKQNAYDERIKKFVSVCNKYLNGKRYIYDESNVELGIYREGSNRPISIQNLSSGEKQIISVFSKLYIEEIKDCIVLFDEPELSLSIMWQSMFLPDIVDSKKCASLIAVTHSPFIFDNKFDGLAKDMGDCLSACN